MYEFDWNSFILLSFHVDEKYTFSDMEIFPCKVPIDIIDTCDVQWRIKIIHIRTHM